jgi:NAD(P)-dependent dehydrogenase (short-subunit alcohol dehydrogenase family)
MPAEALAPGGGSDTKGTLSSRGEQHGDQQAWITNLNALKRVDRPEEIARSMLYLASDDSAFMTATAHLVDGGFSIART